MYMVVVCHEVVALPHSHRRVPQHPTSGLQSLRHLRDDSRVRSK